MALFLAACGSEGDAASRGRYQIAVVPKGTTHEFWKAIHAGAETAASELGVDVIWKGPQLEDDRDEQIKVVESFINRGVDGIVIAPLDDRALAPALQDATARGIPVLVIDSDVEWDGRVSFIASDNYRGGALCADRLGELLEGKGSALMMRYQEGSASTAKREAGFLDTMRAEFPGIEIVSSNQYAHATIEKAMRTAENLLNKFPEVDGIFCPNEFSVFGMLRALQDAGRAGSVKLVGFDASEKLVRGLVEGHVHGLALQNPFVMGDYGVRRMVDHLDGKPVPARIDTGVTIVTKSNMDESERASLLAPDLSILSD